MTDFWLGVLAGGLAVWALGTLTIVAIRGAERSTPMAAGHWEPEPEPDDLDEDLRQLLATDGRP